MKGYEADNGHFSVYLAHRIGLVVARHKDMMALVDLCLDFISQNGYHYPKDVLDLVARRETAELSQQEITRYARIVANLTKTYMIGDIVEVEGVSGEIRSIRKNNVDNRIEYLVRWSDGTEDYEHAGLSLVCAMENCG